MKKKKIRLILITLGVVLILMVGYRLYLEYQTDIQLFLNPRASKEELLAHIRSHGFSASLLLIVLTAVMCAVPGIPTSVIGVIAGLSFGPFIGVGINVLGNALGNISAVFLMHRLKFLDKKTEKKSLGAIHSANETSQNRRHVRLHDTGDPIFYGQFCCRCDEIASSANRNVDRDWSHPFICVVCVWGRSSVSRI